MQVRVTSKHGHLNDELREKLIVKLEKLPRFFERLTEIELVVDFQDAARPEVHLNVNAEHKHDFTTIVSANDPLTAVESAVQKMEQQLRKYKEKVVHRGRGPAASMHEMPVPEPPTALSGDLADEDE